MRALALLGVLCVLGGVFTAETVGSAGAADRATASAATGTALIARIDHYRAVTWRWERLLDLPRTQSAASARRSPDPAYRHWVLRLWQRRATAVQRRALPWLARQVAGYEATVRHWDLVMGVRPPAPLRTTASASALPQRQAEYRLWKARAAAVWAKAQHPPYERAFECIHHYEGSWTDGGAPYWGGLQMDLGFQATYGGYLLRTKGTADHWTPLEQMWVAARAARSGRGFAPWPNSARMCGLL